MCRSGPAGGVGGLGLLGVLICLSGGCATIRVTDPEQTATQQFLENVATQQAVSQLSMNGLRDQLVFVDPDYLFPPLEHPLERQLLLEPSFEYAFLLGELRSRLLKEGVRLTDNRGEATVILEVRSAGVGVDHYEYLARPPRRRARQHGGQPTSAAASSTPRPGPRPLRRPNWRS